MNGLGFDSGLQSEMKIDARPNIRAIRSERLLSALRAVFFHCRNW